MSGMAENWEPGDEAATTFRRYRKAHETTKELKPAVTNFAVQALREGASTSQLSELTGMLPEVFRRLARANGIEPPAEYRGRSEQAKRRAADQ